MSRPTGPGVSGRSRSYEWISSSPVRARRSTTGGILPSGLFWTVQVENEAFRISRDGRRAKLRAEDAPVIDSFTFGGRDVIPAAVSLRVRWDATESPVPRGSGGAVAPTAPAAFLGRFARARSTGVFSGTELGFSFRSDGRVSTDRGFAELGRERNGVFL
jgi:hypothetical protein